MADDDLAVPIDVPWHLLSRRGPDSAADPTSIATFVHVPTLAVLDEQYPDHRLVYFKFTVSVFPFRLDLPRFAPLNVLDENVAPVWRMILDIGISVDDGLPAAPGPYFLSAAPTRRALIETGVVGDYATEGESDQLAVASSGAHLIEGYHSNTTTRRYGVSGMLGLGGLAGGFLPIGGALGGSYTRGSTSISGGREVSEQVDTTSRQASQERRELLSHRTDVNNVLTLLTGSLVGTDRLTFSVWPAPLRPLSVDPNDENLWYAELLRRRSSGIEGMQDFFAIAVLPRGRGFCLTESLRRVSVLEAPLPEPPVQPSVPFDRFGFNLNDFVAVFSYLDGMYPEGTPLEELDVAVEDRLVPDPSAVPPIPANHTRPALQAWYDAVGAVWVPNPLPPIPPPVGLPLADEVLLMSWRDTVKEDILAKLPEHVKIHAVPRPVVSSWTFSNTLAPSMFRLEALTDPPSLPVPYRWVQDVWLEASQYAYETELARSPLERGTLLVDDRKIDICADLDSAGTIGTVTTTIPAALGVGILPPLPGGPIRRPWDLIRSQDGRARGRAMVAAWGTAEARLRSAVAAARTDVAPLTFTDQQLLDRWLAHAARLVADDQRNLRLADLAPLLGLSDPLVGELTSHGVKDLRGLASALSAARFLDRRGEQSPGHGQRSLPKPVAPSILPRTTVRAVARAISAALDTALHTRPTATPDAAGADPAPGTPRRTRATPRPKSP